MSVPTVVWWRQDSDDRLLEFLVVGPGPGPVPGQAWPGTIAQPARAPGDWAIVNLPALGALPGELTQQLCAMAVGERVGGKGVDGEEMRRGRTGSLSVAVIGGSGEVVAERHGTRFDQLYDDCLHAGLKLVGQRLAERVVATEPFSSGVLVARRATGGRGARSVEIAPAMTTGGAGVSPVTPVVGIPLRLGRTERVVTGSVAISLGDAEAATLPSVSILLPQILATGSDFSLDLEVPDLSLPAELLDRWRLSADEDPRLRLAL